MWGRTTWANAEVSSHAPGLANQKRADIPCARAGCPPWENERVPGMVAMQVRQDDPAHLLWREAQRSQLRPDFFFRSHPLAHTQSVVGMPPGEIPWFGDTSSFSRIDHNDPFRMFNHPHIDGQRIGPDAVEQGVETAPNSLPGATNLPLFDRDRSRLDGMYTHQLSPLSFPCMHEPRSSCALSTSQCCLMVSRVCRNLPGSSYCGMCADSSNQMSCLPLGACSV